MPQTKQVLSGYGFTGALVELSARLVNEMATMDTIRTMARMYFVFFKLRFGLVVD